MASEEVWKEKLAKRTRIFSFVFGIVWLVDAILKWMPAFLFNFNADLTKKISTSPDFLVPWLKFVLKITSTAPVFFAVVIAIVETAIALSLLFGVARKYMYVVGFILNIVIWVTAEGFIGRFWTPGATDIGTSIMYSFIFAALWGLEQFASTTNYWTLDQKIEAVWPAWKKVSEWKTAA
ncbi:hypothetical protein E4665_16210 [Sporolactobacillus shoreae]|uniref:DoxX family membrane protein n=1 Tax=Sporolactobacillus shoreae TaxID=1465501 RepID=A0A4Z0GJX4_9BACL|nr:hypothetical protein [Sporolactobacillus shoreae]TGA96227.1 hypothetical protein E4665_16210 [Sporolactobacillus shoreae]